MSKIITNKAPDPVGAYPHARKVGDLLFLSGVGPRKPGTNEIPQGIVAQTESVIENIRNILEAAGSSFDKIVDVQVFLTNMKDDFKAYNEVYAKHFTSVGATRTTIEVGALPTPIAVEFKVIASI